MEWKEWQRRTVVAVVVVDEKKFGNGLYTCSDQFNTLFASHHQLHPTQLILVIE